MKKLLEENETLTQIVYDAGGMLIQTDWLFEKAG